MEWQVTQETNLCLTPGVHFSIFGPFLLKIQFMFLRIYWFFFQIKFFIMHYLSCRYNLLNNFVKTHVSCSLYVCTFWSLLYYIQDLYKNMIVNFAITYLTLYKSFPFIINKIYPFISSLYIYHHIFLGKKKCFSKYIHHLMFFTIHRIPS